MLCAVVLQFTFHSIATRIDASICENETRKLARIDSFAFSCKLFVVVTAKTADSHCLLLEELSHTDLIDQPAFLFCLVDHITRLAVPDQKG